MAPTILLVPGLWEGPSVFDSLSSLLAADGFNTEAASLPSTGSTSPGNPTMKDDIDAIRQHIVSLVSRGDDVLLVLHSASGFLGSEAMQGLDMKRRQERGESGGVVGIVFLTAGLIPEGLAHQTPPFFVVEGGAAHCITPETSLFGDLPEDEKKKWLTLLKPQPSQGWDDTVTYTGWKDVPSVYLICEQDALLPVFLQEQFAGLANSKIVRCSAGHMPQLSQPERVAEVIKTAIADFSN
ncbi:hypothetical protein UA08_02305 [Talaromyces atroroseus]|uniref:AB hydrolase-1 domain-containing protein n=1 Tax=Talaromyces atroroseus TaxID=1441469 RepID=A0A225AS17_TALAT|nr:hypothetical protein UA08_02305 [Talaromyces atroroseus]OKL62293.1 hypothetical protein UA08_02305 [Talaromyces atroroseus]